MGLIIEFVYVDSPKLSFANADWHRVYKRGIIENEERNRDTILSAKLYLEAGRRVLIIVNSLPHGRALSKLAEEFGLDIPFFWSKGHPFYDRNFEKALSEKHALIGSPILDEGVDLPTASAMVLACGGKSHKKVIQRLGRGLRIGDFKDVLVRDYYDNTHPFLKKHSLERISEFRAEHHEVLGYPAKGEPIHLRT